MPTSISGTLEAELGQRLEAIKQGGFYRHLRTVESGQGPEIRMNGKLLVNFSSNDYLGFNQHPALKDAAAKALHDYGSGAGSSRLISGSMRPHVALEEALSDFKGSERSIVFPSGYMAALGVMTALMQSQDVIVLDRLVHASLVDAARLSRATIRVYKHNDLADLEEILHWTRRPAQRSKRRNVLIVTESVFSMEGDRAPLEELVRLKEKFGVWLMVDEAHATGLYGQNGQGLAAQLGIADQVEIHMGTLGKAIGASGGYICGSHRLIDFLINQARSFIFSTAPTPATAAAAAAGVMLVPSAEGEAARKCLWKRVEQFESGLAKTSFRGVTRRNEENGRAGGKRASAIVPLLIGNEKEASEYADQLLRQGIFAPAIRYPSVGRGLARLRLTFTAPHTASHVTGLLEALARKGIGNRD